MRALKLTFALAGLLALIRYVPVYYRASEFNNVVKQETLRNRPNGELKRTLLTKAQEHMLTVREEDINITTVHSVLRVVVDYRVPINFYLFQREMTFHTVAAAWDSRI